MMLLAAVGYHHGARIALLISSGYPLLHSFFYRTSTGVQQGGACLQEKTSMASSAYTPIA